MCCGALLSGRLTRLIRLSVAVSHGSTVLLSTTVGGDRGAKGEAVLGSKTLGIVECCLYWKLYDEMWGG